MLGEELDEDPGARVLREPPESALFREDGCDVGELQHLLGELIEMPKDIGLCDLNSSAIHGILRVCCGGYIRHSITIVHSDRCLSENQWQVRLFFKKLLLGRGRRDVYIHRDAPCG